VATEDAAPRCKRDREASLHYPRYVQEPRATGIGCTNRLLGAEHDYLPMGGQICQGVCKGSKVADASAENLVAPADLFGLASEVLLYRGVAFRVRQLIGVSVADRADDTASQLGFVRLGPLRKPGVWS
jgi:hypothetical protein